MTGSKRGDIDDPLERAATMGVIGSTTAKKSSSERQATPVKRQDAQASKRLEVKAQPPNLPVDDVRKKQTVYLSAGLLKWAKHRAVEEEMEISEVVEYALRQYRETVEGSR